MKNVRVLRTVSEVRAWRRGVTGDLGFVPTMGALHEGHAELLRVSASKHPLTVLSVFVNPLQFGPTEDLQKYPKTLDDDLRLAQQCGVAAVFVPEVSEFTSPGLSTQVTESVFSAALCGTHRPGHFSGVTTIVSKLFLTIQPTHAYFGLKDAQQFLVLKKMVQDLNFPVEMIGIPTVRESSGLALSSRNRYLSDYEKRIAPEIYKALVRARDQILSGATIDKVLSEEKMRLEGSGFRVQYLELRSLDTFEIIQQMDSDKTGSFSRSQALLAFAGYLGTTRLIDNVIF